MKIDLYFFHLLYRSVIFLSRQPKTHRKKSQAAAISLHDVMLTNTSVNFACVYWSGAFSSLCWEHRVHTEWQRPLSGVHSIMMEKLAQPGVEVGGCTPTPVHYLTITYQVVMYAPADRADTLPPYFYSIPVCTLWMTNVLRRGCERWGISGVC